MYWVPLRDRNKMYNGHIVVGLATLSKTVEDMAQHVRTENLGENKADDLTHDHCAIRSVHTEVLL